MSKGSKTRPFDRKKYEINFDRIFGNLVYIGSSIADCGSAGEGSTPSVPSELKHKTTNPKERD